MNRPEVAVVVSTHDREHDARANVEIIRACWTGPEAFGRVRVVHAYNGGRAKDPVAALVDLAVRAPGDRGHFVGAADLIDAGIEAVARHWPEIEYVVCLAADSWVYQPGPLAGIVRELATRGQRMAAADWRISERAHGLRRSGDSELLPATGLSTDVFVVHLPWARENGLFPLDFGGFLDTYAAMLNYFQELPLLERYLEGRFLAAARRDLARSDHRKDPWGSEGPRHARRLLRLLHERRIDPDGLTAPAHKGHWPALGLITSEDMAEKRQLLSRAPHLHGPTLERLRNS